jgi:hypothetical protein
MPRRSARSLVSLAARFVLLALACTFARAARADKTRPTVVIVCPPDDRFGLRVRAELDSLGFQTVVTGEEAGPASRVSLEGAARRAHAIAAIRGVPADGGVDVWIADRVTGKTVLRHVESEPGSPDREAALAIRAVELLRASMLETSLPRRPPGEVPAGVEIRERLQVPALARSVPPEVRVAVGLASVAWSPGGFGTASSFALDLGVMPSEHVGVFATGAASLTSPEIRNPALGSATLSLVVAGVGARFVFTPRESTWEPFADAGVAAVLLRSQGTGASAGLVVGVATGAAAAPFTRVGLAFAATPSVRIRADLLVGVIGQGVSVQIGDKPAASWGLPFLLPSLGIDLGAF